MVLSLPRCKFTRISSPINPVSNGQNGSHNFNFILSNKIIVRPGIYHHVTGKLLGNVAIRLVGYNDEDENNKYWIAVNSWGKSWGDEGKFKIRRGVDECMVDGSLHGVYVYSDADESSSSSSSEEY